MTDRVEVAVVGGGPVGLTAALLLARGGMEVTVLEADVAPNTEWRASTFHPATLELFDDLAVTDEMRAQGLEAPEVKWFDRRDGLVATFDLRDIADETRYPFRLQLEQYKYARIVAERLLRDHGVAVRHGAEVVGVDGTRVRVADGTTVEADLVIGADGARGQVRRALGLDFAGWTYAERFLLLATDFPFEQHLPDLCLVNYMADPDEFLMLLRIPDVWRVLVPIPVDAADASITAPDFLEGVLDRVVPGAADQSSIFQHQLYAVHQRVAERLRIGSVVLAGDAAHVNSPMGGFGLNSGIHDAFDLARRVLRVRAGEGDLDTELDIYDETRRAVALEHVRTMSHRNTSLLSERDPGVRARLLDELRETAANPVARRAYLRAAAMLTHRLQEA